MTHTILLTAAEASGDALGGELMAALRERLGPDVHFIGVGGPAMAGQGLKGLFDISDLSVVGLLEGLLAARRAARRADQLAELAAREQPDAAVLIDSWGFSYLVATRLKARLPGLPLVKYVLPQVWASRPKRAKAAAGLFDLLLSIVAFEPPLFERVGGKVAFVGHPAAALDFSRADPQRLRQRIGASPDGPILLVLPGSRPSEIARLAAPFEDAVRRLTDAHPNLKVVVVAAPPVADQVRPRVAGWPSITVIEDAEGKADAMKAATVALACSGTVTTELAAAGCPMVVAYRLGAVTYRIARRIVRTRFITLFNIAADAEIAPELIQDACNGPTLAEALARRLDDPALRARQAADQAAALAKLGARDAPPAAAAADAIVALLRRPSAAGR